MKKYISEFLWIDVKNEGFFGKYNINISKKIEEFNLQSIILVV